LRTLLITGPGQGEGKTTTTANLGVALAQAGQRVFVVSTDLRKPRLHRFFGVSNERGLADVIQGSVSLRDAIVATEVPNLYVIPAGPVPENPAELLASPVMEQLIEKLRDNSDFVLMDTAPSLVVADALEIAPLSDGVLIVVDGTKTTRQAVVHLRHQLERVGGTIVGGLLNNFDPRSDGRYGRYGYGSYYQTYGETRPAKPDQLVDITDDGEATLVEEETVKGE
jgi:capsular exopolysaccharide synthesis family protein